MPRLCLPTGEDEVARRICLTMKAEVEARYSQFVLTAELKANILNVAKLLTSTDDRHFGILAVGSTGTGKTMFATAVSRVIDSFNLLDNPESNYPRKYRVSRFGAKDLLRRGTKEPDSLSEIALCPAIMIDDLGEEAKEAMSFGNVLTPMVDLFEQRYERRLFTIATTNLSPKELMAKYDGRVASRLNEMMLVLRFTGSDYRVSR